MKQKVTTRTVPAKMLIPWVPGRRGKVPGTFARLGAVKSVNFSFNFGLTF